MHMFHFLQGQGEMNLLIKQRVVSLVEWHDMQLSLKLSLANELKDKPKTCKRGNHIILNSKIT